MRLSEYRARERKITVELEDGFAVNLAYRPGLLTPDFAAQIDEEIEANQRRVEAEMEKPPEKRKLPKHLDSLPLRAWLAKAIISWDIEEDDGKPLPVTPEAMLELESQLLWEIYYRIIADNRADPTRPRNLRRP